jgi:hypothetical protein
MRTIQAVADPPARRARAGWIRRFEGGDIAQVARLHQLTWPGEVPRTPESYHAYFTRVFLEHPFGDSGVSSLIYEDARGKVVAFVGVIPRRLALRGQMFRAAHCSQFVVDPDCPVGLITVAMAKAFFEGPQDLSIADDAGDVARTLWGAFGGMAPALMNLSWTRVLRPAGFLRSHARQRRGLAAIAALSRPLTSGIDAVASRLPTALLRRCQATGREGELSARTAVAQLPLLAGPSTLRVEYDCRMFQWLLERAATQSGNDRLLTGMVWAGREVAGWYIAHLRRDGVADVAQIAASPSSVRDVIDHLFARAWEAGAVAVTGRLEPRFMDALADRYALFHRGPWTVIRATRPEILGAFESGAVAFSSFDGEWPLRFTGRETLMGVS